MKQVKFLSQEKFNEAHARITTNAIGKVEYANKTVDYLTRNSFYKVFPKIMVIRKEY